MPEPVSGRLARTRSRAPLATTAAAWAGYRRVWVAHTTSSFGDQLTLVALPLAAYLRTESALAVGIVSSMEAVTAIAFGLVAGAAADRLPHRRVLFATDAVRAAVLAVVATAVAGDAYPVAVLYGAAAALGALRVLHDAAASAVVPILVQPRDLLRANGEMNASEAAATAAGPALAGGLIALGGPGFALGADAASFAASGALVTRVGRLDEAAPARTAEPIREQIAAGVRVLLSDRPMLLALAMGTALNVVAVAVEGQFIPYAKEVLGIGGLGIGAYWALGGTAAVVTSLLAGRHQMARGDAIVGGLTVFSLGVLLAGVVPAFWTVAVAYVCAGTGSALVVTHLLSLRQLRFDVRLQGRVAMAVRTGIFALVPPAHVGGGALAAEVGPEALFIATATVGLLAATGGVAAGLLRLTQQ